MSRNNNNNEDLYDPHIQRGAGAGNSSGESPFNNLQKTIDGAVGQMRENVNKLSERGERLDNLQNKTNDLSDSANSFRRGANRVRKQMWWKDMKMRMCIIIGIIILLVVIIVPSAIYGSRNH